MLKNITKPFERIALQILYMTLFLLGVFLWWKFTDIAIMFGNYGNIHTITDIILSMIIITMFPLFLVGVIHKGLLFGKRETISGKSGMGLSGGIVGTIISGASCCGGTLAIYFGLIPLMTALPYDGLELKVIAVIGLLWANYDLYKYLELCKMKK